MTKFIQIDITFFRVYKRPPNSRYFIPIPCNGFPTQITRPRDVNGTREAGTARTVRKPISQRGRRHLVIEDSSKVQSFERDAPENPSI